MRHMETAVKKLTPKMEEVLRELAKPNARALCIDYMGRFNEREYWFLSGSHLTCTSQVRGLIARGLVTESDGDKFGNNRHATINDAGRAYLQAATTQPPPRLK
jgi:hypothetical protein